MTNSPESGSPIPKIRSVNSGDTHIYIDPHAAASTMSELGISEEKIADTTILLDGKSRLGLKGIAYPAWLRWFTKRRFAEHADDINGSVVRLSTTMRGEPRSAEAINKTFTHEAEHVAQEERKDRKVTLGHLAIYGGMFAGALAGNLLARDKGTIARAAATLTGAAVGKELGYRNAPHENQARHRANHVRSDAVKVHD